MSPTGILAVLNDIDPACDRAEYEAWYQRDHMPDRLAVPGFRHARRYRRTEGPAQEYFTFYETDSPAVLRTPAYVARLAAPTGWTTAMMRHFRAMCRSIAVVGFDQGSGTGGIVAVIGAAHALPAADAARLAPLLETVTRVRLWCAAEDVAMNPEAALRPGIDTSLGTILVVEGTDASTVRQAAIAGGAALGLSAEPSLYSLLYASPQVAAP